MSDDTCKDCGALATSGVYRLSAPYRAEARARHLCGHCFLDRLRYQPFTYVTPYGATRPLIAPHGDDDE